MVQGVIERMQHEAPRTREIEWSLDLATNSIRHHSQALMTTHIIDDESYYPSDEDVPEG